MPKSRAAGRGEGEQLRRAREQGNGALGRLLESYRGYLTVLVRSQIGPHLRSKVDPCDVVQEAFLKAYRDFPRFRGRTEEELTGWLRQVLATSLAMLVRRYYGTRRRDVRLESRLAEELDRLSRALDRSLVDPGQSPDDQAAGREQARALAAALDRLSADARAVIRLHTLEGLSFPEVARRLNRSVDSVKQLWMRARGRLRRTLDGIGD